MCIHFFEAKYTCGCKRALPPFGPGYQPPRLCEAVKRAHRRYHAQPQHLPLQYPLPAPKACPPIAHTIGTTSPSNIAVLYRKEVCPDHINLDRLCQVSKEQHISKPSFPIMGWREISGNKSSVGEFIGEDGPFKGVERYNTNLATRPKYNPQARSFTPAQHAKKVTAKKASAIVAPSSSSTATFGSDDVKSVRLASLYVSQPVHRLQANIGHRKTKSL